MFDTHGHPHDDPGAEGALVAHFAAVAGTEGTAGGAGRATTHFVLMGTQPSDWPAVERLSGVGPAGHVVAAYGLHPWHAHRFAHDSERAWLAELERRLLANPRAVIGEIGLDKVARTPETGRNEFALQLPVFDAQLALAARLGRPASVHCVRAYGHLLDVVRAADGRAFPPRLAVHSCTGSPEIVKALQTAGAVGERVFFGFSLCICLRSADKTRETIARVHDERILLESDRASVEPIAPEMAEMCALVAEVKGWTAAETAERTTRNAWAWLRGR